MLYAVLRKAHTILAYLFFLTFLAHFGAVLFHTLIARDGILKRMAPWPVRPQQAVVTEPCRQPFPGERHGVGSPGHQTSPLHKELHDV
jgi:hypothetical protein